MHSLDYRQYNAGQRMNDAHLANYVTMWLAAKHYSHFLNSTHKVTVHRFCDPTLGKESPTAFHNRKKVLNTTC